MEQESDRWVYVVEDDHALRFWLCVELGSDGLRVGSFDSGRAFMQALPRLAPGCVVSDLRMENGSGFDLLEALDGHREQFPVLVMTAYSDIATAVRAMKLGAADFIEKPFTGQVLLERIQALQAASAAAVPAQPTAAERENTRRYARLTRREVEVVEGLLAGRQNKQIADFLGISTRTVEAHRAHLMEKMAVRSVAELVRSVLAARGALATPAAEPS